MSSAIHERTDMDSRDNPRNDPSAVSFVAWTVYVMLAAAAVMSWMYLVPRPAELDADPRLFSEARAMKHIRVLSEEIGFRQVSHPGLGKAKEYVEAECRRLAEMANRRSDLEAEVKIEMVSGSVEYNWLRSKMINVYRNLTNVILVIGPKDKMHKPALLINAHYDSALGSPGAADCGSCVGIGLEVVRALIEDPNYKFTSPIILLLNGGEETLLQAAHGFVHQSAYRDRVGGFINLESTGSGGMPILFQYSGDDSLYSYASSVPNARGVVIAQEFFETNLIPADTDFRMFSKDHYGKYPGVDIATVLDATSYHTDRDTAARLKPGTTQEFGEAILALSKSMLGQMTDRGTSATSKLIFTNALPMKLMVYSIDAARSIHLSPLLISLLSIAIASKKILVIKEATQSFVRTVLSCLLCLTLAVAFGVGRTILSGRPMVWFSCHSAAFVLFWTAGAIGFLIPQRPSMTREALTGKYVSISLITGVPAVYLTYQGIGSSVVLFVLALEASTAALIISLSKKIPIWLLMGVGYYCVVWCASFLISVIKNVMEKVGMAGGGSSSFGMYIPDGVVSGINGLFGVVGMLILSPLVTYKWTGRTKWRVIKGLTGLCLATAIASSWLVPYSVENPKRIILAHLCRQGKDLECEYKWAVSSADGVMFEEAVPEELKKKQKEAFGPLDWATTSPLNKNLIGVGFVVPSEPFPPTGPWGSSHPGLYAVEVREVGNGKKRAELELRWDKPGWGAMDIFGEISDWSLASTSAIKKENNVVRFAQDAPDPVWSFWIEFKDKLKIQIGIFYPNPSTELEELRKKFPEWTAVVAGTSFVYELNV